MIGRTFAVFVLIILPAAGQSYGNPSNDAVDVSLIGLIAEPERYTNQLVRVVGVATFRPEGDALWLSVESMKMGVTMNAIWLENSPDSLGISFEKLSALTGKYVLVEGIFTPSCKGHMGLYPGAIAKVTRIIPWGEGWKIVEETDTKKSD